MKTLNTNELTDFLNADSAARAEARTLANIARRAQTLFTDGGYHCHTYTENLAVVISPKEDRYVVWHGEETGDSCSCPCFDKLRTCKHLQAVKLAADEAAQEAALLAEWERMEEVKNFGQFDRYDF